MSVTGRGRSAMLSSRLHSGTGWGGGLIHNRGGWDPWPLEPTVWPNLLAIALTPCYVEIWKPLYFVSLLIVHWANIDPAMCWAQEMIGCTGHTHVGGNKKESAMRCGACDSNSTVCWETARLWKVLGLRYRLKCGGADSLYIPASFWRWWVPESFQAWPEASFWFRTSAVGPENLCFLTNSQVMLTLLAQTLGPRGLNSTGVSRDQWPGGRGARVGHKCPDVWTCILHVQQRLSAVSWGEGSWVAALQFTFEFVQL